MRNLILRGLSVFLLLFFWSCSEKRPVFTETEAIHLLSEYKTALDPGDSTRLFTFWSEHSRREYGFQWMLTSISNFLPFSEYCQFVQTQDFEIAGIEAGDGHYALRYKWIEKGTAEGEDRKSLDMIAYVIRENGKWVFAQPREIFTRGWKTFESDYFIYHVPGDVDIDGHREEIRFLDEKCREITDHLGIDLDKKFHYYKARSTDEVSKLVTTGKYHGVAVNALGLLVSIRFCHVHELAHLLYWNAGIRAENPIFSEGFAVAFGGVSGTTAEFADIESKNLIGSRKYVPLKELLTNPSNFVRNNFITYFEAGSFLKFIDDRFGLDKLKEVCRIPKNDPDVIQRIESIVGYTIEELEQQWHASLNETDVPSIGHSIPCDAEKVFSMDDSEGDDVGDGDYVYPHQRFEEGVFDLRKFEVFKDTSRVYFRTTFQKRTHPVIFRTGEAFLPGCVIAINKGDGEERFLQRECNGIRFEAPDGYDLKISAGTAVAISDRFGRVYFSSPEIFEKISDLDKSTVSFSFPQEVIGEPNECWKYFVGVGLMSNRSMNFLYGGPEPVRRDHPVFIRGGNYDHGNPAFIDILLPEKMDQRKILSNYRAEEGRLAVAPMVGLKR